MQQWIVQRRVIFPCSSSQGTYASSIASSEKAQERNLLDMHDCGIITPPGLSRLLLLPRLGNQYLRILELFQTGSSLIFQFHKHSALCKSLLIPFHTHKIPVVTNCFGHFNKHIVHFAITKHYSSKVQTALFNKWIS